MTQGSWQLKLATKTFPRERNRSFRSFCRESLRIKNRERFWKEDFPAYRPRALAAMVRGGSSG